MPLPKRKKDIVLFDGKELLPRRQELLDRIVKSDTYLPDSILHDDMDRGMLDYVEKNFRVVSDNKKIPVIPKILTIQRWSELQNTWEFVDDDNNIQLPFISVIRQPDVQFGTHPSLIRTIPDRKLFHYATVKTWNGGQLGADVYKIPQPIPVDITYEITIVCNKFRDLNKFNKIVLQRFTSRQDYTTIKGHYIPLILDQISDTTPMDSIDGRRFYVQNYKFIMMGFLIDAEEFEVSPAVNRTLILTETVETREFTKRIVQKTIDITIASFVGDGVQVIFSVGETMGILFYVTINGLKQELGIDFYHIAGTSKITFVEPPVDGSNIVIAYYKDNRNFIIDENGRPIQFATENFIYDGSTLEFTVSNSIDSVVTLDINGLVEEEGEGFTISADNKVTLTNEPVIGSRVSISYLY